MNERHSNESQQWFVIVYPRWSKFPYDWLLVGPLVFLHLKYFAQLPLWEALGIAALILLGVSWIKAMFDSRHLEVCVDSCEVCLRRVYSSSMVNDIRERTIRIGDIVRSSINVGELKFPPLVWVFFQRRSGRSVRVFFNSKDQAAEFRSHIIGCIEKRRNTQ